MPLIPLNRINSVDVNVDLEVDKLAAYKGVDDMKSTALQEVYFTYKDLKLLKFFETLYRKYGDVEALNLKGQRTYDIFDVDLGRGKLFIIVDITPKALNAFNDDGLVLLKLREWIEESCKRVVNGTGKKPILEWDSAFYGKGTRLPSGVRVISLYNANYAPDVPALTLAIYKA